MTTGTSPPELDVYGCIGVVLLMGSMIVVCWLISSVVIWLLGGV